MSPPSECAHTHPTIYSVWAYTYVRTYVKYRGDDHRIEDNGIENGGKGIVTIKLTGEMSFTDGRGQIHLSSGVK